MFVPPYLGTFFKKYSGKEVNKLFRKPMKMRDLEFLGVPSYIVDILEKEYSSHLLAVQEEAVREYGVLDFGERGKNNDNRNLLVVAPTSSGKTFIGEIAAITQAIHQKKTVYLVPLRSLAEEKYRHFKKLYGGADCKIDIRVSSRDRREDDRKIIKGDYQVAVMVYEKFNYFLLKYPKVLKDVSLVIIDELQMIHDPARGPLLEKMIERIRKSKANIRFIGLSAYLENEAGFLSWFPASHLLSCKRPVELRKGIMRGGVFRYVTHNKREYGEEEFFKVKEGQDTPYEDCLRDTVSCFIEKDEPTLLFFPTKKETRKWAGWLAEAVDVPKAEEAIAELSRMEETRSRDELLYLLEKGIAYHNADLSWEERNLVENYSRSGEIKIICATTTLAMGINLPFKNVILSGDKYKSDDGDYKGSYRTSLSLADVENMGGRAGRLNWKKGEFGRVIFLANSLFAETVLQNIYFKLMKEDRKRQKEVVGEDGELYGKMGTGTGQVYRPVKGEKDFTTFLLRAVVDGEDSKDKLKDYLRGVTPDFSGNGSYWAFDFEKEGTLEEEIDFAIEELVEHNLITEELSATEEGVLLCAKGIGIKTYLFFKEYLENKKSGCRGLSNLEIITLLALSEEGKRFYIPFPQFGHVANRYNWNDWKGQYYRKMRHLLLEAGTGEEYKEVYRHIFDFGGGGENNSWDLDLDLEDFLSIKKAVFLYDWIGEKEIRKLEEEHKIYGGAVRKLGEEFSWLADALGGVAESLGWDGDDGSGSGSSGDGSGSDNGNDNGRREGNSGKSVLTEEDEIMKDNLGKIRILSERLAWGVQEEGLGLARLHIPGLGRSYVRALLREGYDNRKCLEELGEEELAKVVPERVAGRIKRKFSGAISSVSSTSSSSSPPPRKERTKVRVSQNTKDQQLMTILEIDQHRPDRIIFEGKEVKVTATEFSLIHLLAQNRGKILTHNDLLDTVWKENKYATYTQITYHLYKVRRVILKAIGNNKKNKEKIKDILKVISRRGIMLNLEEDKLKIN